MMKNKFKIFSNSVGWYVSQWVPSNSSNPNCTVGFWQQISKSFSYEACANRFLNRIAREAQNHE